MGRVSKRHSRRHSRAHSRTPPAGSGVPEIERTVGTRSAALKATKQPIELSLAQSRADHWQKVGAPQLLSARLRIAREREDRTPRPGVATIAWLAEQLISRVE